MACFHPNIAQYRTNAITKKNGDLGTYVHIIYASSKDFKGYGYYLRAHKKIQERDKDLMKQQNQEWGYMLIPCGKCLGCAATYRREWALRIDLECRKYAHNYFLTLTYDDEHIKIPKSMKNPSTGEIYYNKGTWIGTLVKEDVTQFLDSLRHHFIRDFNHTGMKFYYCGEYGEKGQRPHYHLLMMNCPELDLTFIGRNPKTKDHYYTNKRIETIWGKGFITIGKVTWESASYVAGYASKKLFGTVKDTVHSKLGQIPIFANMSRRPGIGQEYFEEHKDEIYSIDSIVTSKGQSVRPPKYFDRLMKMDIGESDVMEKIKKHRRFVADAMTTKRLRNRETSLETMLFNQEEIAKNKQTWYNRGRIKPPTVPDLQPGNILPKMIRQTRH